MPKEYILYDAVTGEHLERPNMIRPRKLMLDRQIAGVIVPALDRLSREPIHIGIFEFQAQYVALFNLSANTRQPRVDGTGGRSML